MRDDVDEALQALDGALRRNLDRTERAIKRAEELRNARAEGRTWTDVVRAEEQPRILEIISANLEELYQAGGRLRRVEARALHDEGMSMEQIARLFGVTRQRVSALLRGVREREALVLDELSGGAEAVEPVLPAESAERREA
jgi:DNA-directed RNA polymerase specialized sigma subunit